MTREQEIEKAARAYVDDDDEDRQVTLGALIDALALPPTVTEPGDLEDVCVFLEGRPGSAAFAVHSAGVDEIDGHVSTMDTRGVERHRGRGAMRAALIARARALGWTPPVRPAPSEALREALSLLRGCYAPLPGCDPGILAFADRALRAPPADLSGAARIRDGLDIEGDHADPAAEAWANRALRAETERDAAIKRAEAAREFARSRNEMLIEVRSERDAAVSALATARSEERERCAVVCDRAVTRGSLPDPYDLAAILAARIRALPSTATEERQSKSTKRWCARCGDELRPDATECDDPSASGAGSIGCCGGKPTSVKPSTATEERS